MAEEVRDDEVTFLASWQGQSFLDFAGGGYANTFYDKELNIYKTSEGGTKRAEGKKHKVKYSVVTYAIPQGEGREPKVFEVDFMRPMDDRKKAIDEVVAFVLADPVRFEVLKRRTLRVKEAKKKDGEQKGTV